MGSKRFRGKVLKKIYNKPLILILIERLKKSRLINRIVVATSIKKNDDILYNLCSKKNIHCFRGPELDVLSRYYKCAIQHNATTVVRITADCPMIDPKLVDKIIKFFFRKKFDYVSNTTPLETSTWPNGSDVEVFSFKALKKINQLKLNKNYREHVTNFFINSKKFTSYQIKNYSDWSKFRYTVDYPKDLKLVKKIVYEINKKKIFGYTKEIIDLLKKFK